MQTSLPLCVYAPLRLVRVSMATLLLHSNLSSYNGAFIHAYMLHAYMLHAYMLHASVFCMNFPQMIGNGQNSFLRRNSFKKLLKAS